ncbi:hypothetical protein ACK2SD_06945 [Pseudomonas sp. SC11]|uniref:hypothetical protein n=1 Tax=Pseudomonas sp. SC11 TaxID=326927 RepID=UPI00399BEFF9
MIRLPILNIFPFTFEEYVAPVNPFLLATLGQESPPRPQITVNNALDFARYSARKRGACNHLDDFVVAALDNNGGSKFAWLQNMPDNSQVPAILRYQTNHDNTYEMMGELERLQTTLSPGQVLFHGGHWKWELQRGTIVRQDVPLSTSLTAVTSACHSRDSGKQENGPFYLWVIKIGGSFKAPVYFYNYYEGSDHRHEFEVLIAPGSLMRVESVEPVEDYYLVCVVLE